MRCLVIAPQPFFSPRGTPFSVYYRTLIMSELGAKIDLLTYGEGEDVDIANVRILRVPRLSWLGNVKTGPSMLKLFLDMFVLFRTIGLLIRNRYDVVHAHEEAVFFSRFLKPVFRFKLIYDMHSSLPQQLSNFDYTRSRLIHKIFRSLEDSSINAADAVITICPDLADYVDSVIVDRDRHFLIENSIFEPVKLSRKPGSTQNGENEIPSLDHLRDKTCFVYAGTLEHYQGIGLLIESFRRVADRDPRAYLLIAGGTEEQVAMYRQQAKESGIGGRCEFTGRVPQYVATEYTRRAAVLVSPRTEGTNTPLKVYQQLASGIPLVATNIYSHTQVLSDEVAFLADPEPEDFGRAMLEAGAPGDQAAGRVKAALELYDREYSRQSYVLKLSQVMGKLA